MALTGVLSLVQTIVAFIIVLGILIFFHEMGHHLAAKKFGIMVQEFALGFGPRLISRKRGETVYSIRAFPLGGFCKMVGEMPHEEKEDLDPAVEKAIEGGRAFYQKPAWQRFLVIALGPLMNIFLAFLLFSLIFIFIGVPTAGSPTTDVGDVFPGEPAAEAGIRPGDSIVAIEGEGVSTWDDMASIIGKNAGNEIEVQVQRRDELLTFSMTPVEREDGSGAIGIYQAFIRDKVSPWEAVSLGVYQTWGVTVAVVQAFVDIITRQAPAEVGGPVRIAQMVGDAARVGLDYLMNFTAFISINLAIINLLPIPALDGGRLLFLIAEIIRGKAIDPEKEGLVHFVGFVLLLVLIGVIIVRDITQIF